MGTKAAIIKFGPQNKGKIKGKVKHSRTGACTCPAYQRCFHGQNYKKSR